MNNTFILKNILHFDYGIILDQILKIKMILIIGCLFVFFLTIFYAIQYNAVMELGFEARTQEGKIASLEQRNKDLRVGFTNSTSLDNIEETALDSGFKRVENVAYLEVMESSFAKIK